MRYCALIRTFSRCAHGIEREARCILHAPLENHELERLLGEGRVIVGASLFAIEQRDVLDQLDVLGPVGEKLVEQQPCALAVSRLEELARPVETGILRDARLDLRFLHRGGEEPLLESREAHRERRENSHREAPDVRHIGDIRDAAQAPVQVVESRSARRTRRGGTRRRAGRTCPRTGLKNSRKK